MLVELLSSGALSRKPRPPYWATESPAASDLEAVTGLLTAALPRTVVVQLVLRVECGLAASVYSAVRPNLGPERLLWHGTSWDCVANIVHHGFNRAYAFGGRHGAKLGRGTYFSEDPTYALRFCGRGAPRALLLAGVLPGRFARGVEGLIEPPVADSSGSRFDSTVDDPACPKVFCVFKDFQALPLYLAEVA